MPHEINRCTACPQVLLFHSTLVDEMHEEPNSCLYQVAYGYNWFYYTPYIITLKAVECIHDIK